MKKREILFSTVVAIGVLYTLERLTECRIVDAFDNDKGIHNKLFIVKGKVIELNNSDLGKTPANGSTTLIFQKDGCKSCLIATAPDIDGNYQVRLGGGKYRLIVTNPSPPENDLLAPDQERYIDTQKSSSQVVNFDVNLKLPN